MGFNFKNKKENNENLTEEKVKTKKPKKEKKVKEKSDVKFKEKFSLGIRRRWLVNGTKTFLLFVICFLVYITLNLFLTSLKLPEIDITKNKIYSLSDASKSAIEKVDQDIKIYTYGFEEDSQLLKFLEKYHNANNKITYERLTEDNNYEMIKENDLKEGYYVLIFQSGESRKVVDASSEFSTYDYTTGQQIDTTEQAITNSILSLLVENKPKIYFTEGHQEFSLSNEMSILKSYLANESFEAESINLATVSAVPDDCAVLAIMSPATDFFDIERDMILNYISKGGDIYFCIDPLSSSVDLPNIRTILNEYGVSVQNGQIIELQENLAVQSSPNIFKPTISSNNPITADIYSSKGEIWVAYSSRLQFQDEDTLKSLNVEKEDLMTSSESSIFVTDLTKKFEDALATSETGSSIIASAITKTLGTAEQTENESEENNSEENNANKSVMIISATGSFISDYKVPALSSSYPISAVANNKDFVINSLAELANKEGITVRKEVTSDSTYVASQTQKVVVTTIIFFVPIAIIFTGIVVWLYRKKRK